MVQSLRSSVPSLADLTRATTTQPTPTLAQLVVGASQDGNQAAIDAAVAKLEEPSVIDNQDTMPFKTGGAIGALAGGLVSRTGGYGSAFPSTDLGGLGGIGEPKGQSNPSINTGKYQDSSPTTPTSTGPDDVSQGANDISQGQYGDCGLIAAIGEVATINPQIIDNNIKPAGVDAQGHQTYDVKLFVDNKWQTYNVTDQDTHWATDKNGTDYATLYEAAVGKALGGSDKVQGQWTQDMLHMITGQSMNDQEGPDNQTNTLDAVQNGAMAVAEGAQPGVYDATTGEPVNADKPGPGQVQLYGPHAYAVLGVSGQAPDRSITMHNPWGQGNGSGGTFTISEEAFKKLFGKSGFTEGQTST